MDVHEIVKKYLQTAGYDGLVEEHGDCACLSTDLAPCGEMKQGCVAGHRVDCHSGCNFHIVPGKGTDTAADTEGHSPVR